MQNNYIFVGVDFLHSASPPSHVDLIVVRAQVSDFCLVVSNTNALQIATALPRISEDARGRHPIERILVLGTLEGASMFPAQGENAVHDLRV